MKEYFYLKDKEQKGPFTAEQLMDKGLTNETLIWTEGMEDWAKLKNIPELIHQIKPKMVPPPPPLEIEGKIGKTEVFGQLKVTTTKEPNPNSERLKPNIATLKWLIVWCSFHLFALLMSYSQVEVFNDEGEPDTKKFWPIVKFTKTLSDFKEDPVNYNDYPLQRHGSNSQYSGRRGRWVEETYFNGIFVDYDWTEFVFYIGCAVAFYLFSNITNKEDKKVT